MELLSPHRLEGGGVYSEVVAFGKSGFGVPGDVVFMDGARHASLSRLVVVLGTG